MGSTTCLGKHRGLKPALQIFTLPAAGAGLFVICDLSFVIG
jgi:hypothetical protein